MRNIAHLLLALALFFFTVTCQQTKPGHYVVVLKDDANISLRDHIVWANSLNDRGRSRFFGVKDSYECIIGKGYFAHISGHTATEIEKSDEVAYVIPQSTWPFATAPSSEDIIVDKKMDPNNWGLVAISSNPPIKNGKGPYKYHKSSATGTFIYILDSGIQSDDKEFEGRVVHGWEFQNTGGLEPRRPFGDDLSHGTFVAGIAGGVRHGVAKNATLIDVKIGYDNTSLVRHYAWDSSVYNGLCWAANDIANQGHANKSVLNLSISVSHDHCEHMRDVLKKLFDHGITVVAAAGNDGMDVKNNCLSGSDHVITVGALDKQLNAANFSDFGTGVTAWAPGVQVRSVLSAAILEREYIGAGWPNDLRDGTSYAAPHVSGMIAGWMGETEEGLSVKQVREKLDELSHRDVVGTDLFKKHGVPEDEWDSRLANNRMAYNGADN